MHCAGQDLALPHAGWPTSLKLTFWDCGTNMSTLQRKRDPVRQNRETESAFERACSALFEVRLCTVSLQRWRICETHPGHQPENSP